MYYLAAQNRSFCVEFYFSFAKDARGIFDVLKLTIAVLGHNLAG
jgi:hypothetical protein